MVMAEIQPVDITLSLSQEALDAADAAAAAAAETQSENQAGGNPSPSGCF